ncbi:phosphoribosylglycinamide formyltransferase [Prevotella sp. E13-17]|uniref:phosphoribosylglycinamide formyltransferase n=1 Tax=Prevotella sp. E13-17 TaxID=2913616 RepID=UPI001EDB394C|nr:phosphoribosylglycinamide formyltransferase [Prevotella sp. E13-17]UKK49826.1 phosphoribosylglycinamide formyltransferase [Prevotella sp. E13-17]
MKTTNVAIFASGNGTNCENIIKHFAGSEEVKIKFVLSNRSSAFALVRAQQLGVETIVVDSIQLKDESTMMDILQSHSIDYIILAGFLPIVPSYIVNSFPNHIVNIHPSLLPKFGGKGMWGHHVHEAVKAAGEAETGITIHFVNDECDSGTIIKQFKVSLSPDDTAKDIEEKVHNLEMTHFPKVLECIFSNKFA